MSSQTDEAARIVARDRKRSRNFRAAWAAVLLVLAMNYIANSDHFHGWLTYLLAVGAGLGVYMACRTLMSRPR